MLKFPNELTLGFNYKPIGCIFKTAFSSEYLKLGWNYTNYEEELIEHLKYTT